MNEYKISSLLELVTDTTILYLKNYTTNQLGLLPVPIKDLLRVKALRRHSRLSSASLSSLLHDLVPSVELSLIKAVNKDHIRALETAPKIHILKLTSLDLENCKCVISAVPKRSGQICSKTGRSQCRECEQISDTLRTTLSSFQSLVRVELSYNPTIIDDEIILTIVQASPNLQQLEVDSCTKITDNSVAHKKGVNNEEVIGLVMLTSLHSINLSGTSISDQGLMEFQKYSKSRHTLRELVLNRCDEITDSGIHAILDTFDDLEICSFAQCKNVTWVAASMLGEYFEKRKSHQATKQYNGMKQISFSIW